MHLQTVEREIGTLLELTGILFIIGSMADIGYWYLEALPKLGTAG